MSECTAVRNDFNTGNDILILHEIRHALKKLLEEGLSTTIDLRALPMAPGEEERIEAFLGEGEISVQLNALGPSKIMETEIAGVWLVTHYNEEQEILGKFIEITRVPALIESQTEDMERSLKRLAGRLTE